MQRHFDQELGRLRERLVRMAGTIEAMIQACLTAIHNKDSTDLAGVFEREHTVNQLHKELSEMAVLLIARHQPVADDLRLLVASLSIIANLERMGDLSVNLARKIDDLVVAPRTEPLLDRLVTMLETVQSMVVASVDAFVRQETATAEKVLRDDDVVDAARDDMTRVVVERIPADRSRALAYIEALLASRNIERIADHATNVAQDVIYLVQGRDVRHEVGESHETPGSWRQLRSIPPEPAPASDTQRN
jgi:phosphate transport system protein